MSSSSNITYSDSTLRYVMHASYTPSSSADHYRGNRTDPALQVFHPLIPNFPAKLFHSWSAHGFDIQGNMMDVSQGSFRGVPILLCDFHVLGWIKRLSLAKVIIELAFRSTTGVAERSRTSSPLFRHIIGLPCRDEEVAISGEYQHPHVAHWIRRVSNGGEAEGESQRDSWSSNIICEDDPTRLNRMTLEILPEPGSYDGPPAQSRTLDAGFTVVLIGYQGDFRVSLSVNCDFTEHLPPCSSFRWKDTAVLNGRRVKKPIDESFSSRDFVVDDEAWADLVSRLESGREGLSIERLP